MSFYEARQARQFFEARQASYFMKYAKHVTMPSTKYVEHASTPFSKLSLTDNEQ